MIHTLKDKKIILGVTGSIAAYKAVYLLRLLIKAGAEVQVLMTKSAKEFVNPLTFSTLSNKPVLSEIIHEESWNSHVELGLWADHYIIAPTTASTLSKLANGICDNILVAVYLSSRCPVSVAPAMDLDMWKHASTQRNVNLLAGDNVNLIPVESGELASGLVGLGRMAEPENIITFLVNKFSTKKKLINKTVLITSGPTQESLDPVRFITNHSSGKMGFALAHEAHNRGANVIFISGPSNLRPKGKNITIIDVKSAEDMFNTTKKHYSASDISIFTAAVADYTPKSVSSKKIKKNDASLSLELIKTKDIAYEMGKIKNKNQINIGFALETNDEQNNALKKIITKNFDFIVLNSLNDKGAGFGHQTNKVQLIDKHNNIDKYELKSKADVAVDIFNKIDNVVTR